MYFHSTLDIYSSSGVSSMPTFSSFSLSLSLYSCICACVTPSYLHSISYSVLVLSIISCLRLLMTFSRMTKIHSARSSYYFLLVIGSNCSDKKKLSPSFAFDVDRSLVVSATNCCCSSFKLNECIRCHETIRSLHGGHQFDKQNG